VAFYALLSLFPFLLLSLTILGRVSADDHDRASILGFVLQYFPRQFDFVTQQLDAFRQSKAGLGIGGSVVMVWAALGFFGAITSAINYAFQVKPFGYWKHKLVSFLMLVAASLLMLAGLILLSARTVLVSHWLPSAPMHLPVFAALGSLMVEWLSSLIFIVVVGLLFYFVPNARVRFRDVWPGAIVTGVLWRLALKGFGWYVRDLSRFSVHGSVAAVVVFLMWIYLSAVILIYGVEFTVAYARLRRGISEEKMPVDAIEPGTEVVPEAAPSAEAAPAG
jgi:membrane protein